MGKRVFVLGYLSDPTDDTSSSDVLGVFKTKEDAQKAMKEEFETAKDEHESEEEEIKNFDVKLFEGSTECSICHYGSYYEWTIYELEF